MTRREIRGARRPWRGSSRSPLATPPMPRRRPALLNAIRYRPSTFSMARASVSRLGDRATTFAGTSVDAEPRVSAGEDAAALGLATADERSTAGEGAPAEIRSIGRGDAAAADVVESERDPATVAVFSAGVFGRPAGGGIDRTKEACARLTGALRSAILGEPRGALRATTGGTDGGSATSGRRAGSGRARGVWPSRPTGASIAGGSIAGSDGSTADRRVAGI